MHTGTWPEKIAAPGPTFAPSARRYSTYSGEPAPTRTSGFDRTSVLTTQNRTYPRLQIRIRCGFQRPISTHLAAIGTVHSTRKTAPPKTAARR